jgi:hypothetical protein
MKTKQNDDVWLLLGKLFAVFGRRMMKKDLQGRIKG